MIVIYLLTNKCNANCDFCLNIWKNSNIDEVENKFLVIDRIKEATDFLVLSGGEPFEFCGILDLINYAYSLGMKIIIQTNGINLNKKVISLIKNKVLAVQVSLEGLEKEHNSLTHGNFKKSLQAIKALKENGINTMTNFTITKKNYKCVREYVSLLDGLKVNVANFTLLYPFGNALKNYFQLKMDDSEMEQFCHEFSHLKTKNTLLKIQSPLPAKYGLEGEKCGACKNEIAVQPNGDVTPCPSSSLVLGNILNEKLDEILEKEISQKLKATKNRHKCPIMDGITYKVYK